MSFLFKKGFSSEILTTSVIVDYAKIKFVAFVVLLIQFILGTRTPGIVKGNNPLSLVWFK